MKSLIFLILLTGSVTLLTYCSSSKKARASAKMEASKVVYENNLQLLIMSNCSPCHIKEKGGTKKAYDNIENVKTDIDEIIRRMELNPTEKGFMPFRKTEKLSDSTILVFKKWKEDGMLER